MAQSRHIHIHLGDSHWNAGERLAAAAREFEQLEAKIERMEDQGAPVPQSYYQKRKELRELIKGLEVFKK